MKNLMKVFSIFLVFCLVCVILASGIFLDNVPEFVKTISQLFTINIIPIITLSACALTLEKKNESYFVRIAATYTLISILLSIILAFVPLEEINTTLYDVIRNIYNFVGITNLYILVYSLLSIINPNNIISNTIKKIAYITMGVTIIATIWVLIKEQMIEKLPNVYGYKGFGFSSLAETKDVTIKILAFSQFVEVFAIILTYVTNYAFESDTIQSENLNYDELKKQAENVSKSKINDIYTIKAPEQPVVNTPPENPKVINLNSQLGVNSNVGKIENSVTSQPTFVDKAIPTSTGPVVNSNINAPSNNQSNQSINANPSPSLIPNSNLSPNQNSNTQPTGNKFIN